MLAKIRKRITYTNVAMTMALVLAMSGGAYAAGKIIITSTKQISPSVIKKLAGKTGAKGAAGPQGPSGPAGPAGPAGPQGTNGTGSKGEQGIQGIQGEKGEKGPKGVPGNPWVAGGVLPEGATETGGWAVGVGEAKNVNSPNAERTAISFSIPLEKELGNTDVESLTVGEKTANCPGTVGKPEAKSGFLCVYTGASSEMALPSPIILKLDGGAHPIEEFLNEKTGASSAGAILTDGAEEPYVAPFANGSWAVTG
jgi:hypothetical protein